MSPTTDFILAPVTHLSVALQTSSQALSRTSVTETAAEELVPGPSSTMSIPNPSPRIPSPALSSDSESDLPQVTMTAITLPSGISLQPGALPTLPNVPSTSIDAAFCDDVDMAFRNYFEGLSKPVEEKNWLTRGMTCFSLCPPIWNWIGSKRVEFVGKPWMDFMAAFCKQFLKEDWHDVLHMEMTCSFMKESDNFVTWIENLIATNNCLCNTPSFFTDKQFISIIGANVCQTLYKTAQTNSVYNTTWKGLSVT
jgi:hypothetical protein